jgi:hypothetical protein
MQFYMVAGELVVVGSGGGSHQFFEPWCVDGYQFPAYVALQVMMMWFERPCQFVALFEPRVDDFDNPQARK